jgi:hypothetical protein
VDAIAPLDDSAAIAAQLRTSLRALQRGEAPLPDATAARSNSRRARAAELATLLEEAVDSAPA